MRPGRTGAVAFGSTVGRADGTRTFCDARGMRSHAVLLGVAAGLVIVGAVAAAGAAWSGFVLADGYRPHAPGADLVHLPAAVRSSDIWSDRQLRALVLSLVTALAGVAVVAWLAHGPARAVTRSGLVYVWVVAAVAAAVATLVTRGQVQWAQLALRSVTDGTDASGYWFAAFDGDVRSVFVGDDQVSPGRYAAVMLVHLAGPLVGTVALAVAGGVLLRTLRAGTPADD